MDNTAEHLDLWIMGRTEEVMVNVLRMTRQSEDKLLPIMANVSDEIEGMLHVLAQFDFFERIEIRVTPAQEAASYIERFLLGTADPLATLDQVAEGCATEWCNYLLEFIGLLMIAAEKTMSSPPGKGSVTLTDGYEDEE